MPANVDGMVREGISAYRAGRKDEARALLLRAVEIDQYNEQAWLWLSAVVESVDEQRTCLENVLTINPANERAKQGVQMLSQKNGPALSTSAASSQADDVLASTSFTTQLPPLDPAANPFSLDEDELPSSIEWETPPTATSSASSNYRVPEPSPAEYDDWVSNLNLGAGGMELEVETNPTLDAAQQFIASSFDEDDLFSEATQDEEEDLFSSGPFSASETPMPTRTPDAPARSASSVAASFSSAGIKSGNDPLLDEIETDDVMNGAFLDEFEDGELEKLDASEFFQYIPREIKATRLPGTRERYPVLLVLGLVGLVILNFGAIALLVMNLTTK